MPAPPVSHCISVTLQSLELGTSFDLEAARRCLDSSLHSTADSSTTLDSTLDSTRGTTTNAATNLDLGSTKADAATCTGTCTCTGCSCARARWCATDGEATAGHAETNHALGIAWGTLDTVVAAHV